MLRNCGVFAEQDIIREAVVFLGRIRNCRRHPPRKDLPSLQYHYQRRCSLSLPQSFSSLWEHSFGTLIRQTINISLRTEMISNILCKYAGWLCKRRKMESNKEKGERERARAREIESTCK
jgi:hypothetical protein